MAVAAETATIHDTPLLSVETFREVLTIVADHAIGLAGFAGGFVAGVLTDAQIPFSAIQHLPLAYTTLGTFSALSIPVVNAYHRRLQDDIYLRTSPVLTNLDGDVTFEEFMMSSTSFMRGALIGFTGGLIARRLLVSLF
jgi:hypothetical protein